ncbi:MAG: hypothetical protein AC479_08195 [miscellaneous Crenarchaeota group-6 archaeon AD8-1]|nr:MAG: hypothetical protein AC479_08195 [miscellaneous Crenarchaeota group-6 archaeon AD8-1]
MQWLQQKLALCFPQESHTLNTQRLHILGKPQYSIIYRYKPNGETNKYSNGESKGKIMVSQGLLTKL